MLITVYLGFAKTHPVAVHAHTGHGIRFARGLLVSDWSLISDFNFLNDGHYLHI